MKRKTTWETGTFNFPFECVDLYRGTTHYSADGTLWIDYEASFQDDRWNLSWNVVEVSDLEIYDDDGELTRLADDTSAEKEVIKLVEERYWRRIDKAITHDIETWR